MRIGVGVDLLSSVRTEEQERMGVWIGGGGRDVSLQFQTPRKLEVTLPVKSPPPLLIAPRPLRPLNNSRPACFGIRLESPIHILTQSCDQISCCGKPVERTNEIGLDMTSLVHSAGFK